MSEEVGGHWGDRCRKWFNHYLGMLTTYSSNLHITTPASPGPSFPEQHHQPQLHNRSVSAVGVRRFVQRNGTLLPPVVQPKPTEDQQRPMEETD